MGRVLGPAARLQGQHLWACDHAPLSCHAWSTSRQTLSAADQANPPAAMLPSELLTCQRARRARSFGDNDEVRTHAKVYFAGALAVAALDLLLICLVGSHDDADDSLDPAGAPALPSWASCLTDTCLRTEMPGGRRGSARAPLETQQG